MEKEEVRKGAWSEEEDVDLVFYVKLFGDRRWDFIAKVSGLKRSGKSCRLRWVNYLQPGLKRDKMTLHEERLVVHLQSIWGNRWSRIARKLPGRTDNEIKNYWRTHLRKEAHEKKKKIKGSPSSSSDSKAVEDRSFYDTGGANNLTAAGENKIGLGLEVEEGSNKVYSMDDIWKEFEVSECLTSQPTTVAWDEYCTTDSLWCMNIEEETKMLMGDHNFQSFPLYDYMIG